MGKSHKREREKAMREYERKLAFERAQAAKRHRRNVIVGSSTAAIVVIALVAWAVAAATNTGAPAATATTPPSAATTVSPDATPDDGAAATPAPTASYALPPASAAEGRDWTGTIKTSVGTLDVTLDGAKAPQAVASFVSLAKQGFFDATSCHRLTTGESFKVLQCGDPSGNGTGGPGYSFGPIENAPTDGKYPKGTIAMARVGGDANSMGSQFFIVYGDTVIPNDQAGGYTVFGTVTGGLDAIEKVGAAGTETGTQDGAPKTPVTIEGVSLK